MEVRQRLAQQMRRLRAAKGLSQEELSDRTGLHRTYISGIERGVRNPTITIVARIADGLGVTVEELLARPANLAK